MTRLRLIGGKEGQSLVELAFISPLLISLLFGAAEYGRLCYVSIEVTNAAHAAADYGAQNRGTASDNSGMTLAATNDGANLTNLQVTPQHLCAATYSDTPTSDCTGTPAVEYVQVNTQVTVASLFHSSGFGGNYTLHGQAMERVRQ
jgi:Flp pilus assembly protein TadG